MKLLIGIILMLSNLVCLAESNIPQWANTDAKTQGGNWFWFPGKGSDSLKRTAEIKAIGAAVSYLMSECRIPHKNVKINERFEVKVNGIWKVYLRVAVTHSDCKESKFASAKKLTMITNYALLNLKNQYDNLDATVDITVCNEYHIKKCLEIADTAWGLKNLGKALLYAKRGCDLGDSYICGFYGLILWQTGALPRAKAYLSMSCEGYSQFFCKYYKQINNLK